MPENKYMTLKDVKLKQPLATVKRAEGGTDILVMPEKYLNTIIGFFRTAGIGYQVVEDVSGYPDEQLQSSLEQFCSAVEYEDDDTPYECAVLLSVFDSTALIDWAAQIYGPDMDPSFRQYLEDRAVFAERCYHTHDEGWPQVPAATFFESEEKREYWINRAMTDPHNLIRLAEWSLDEDADEAADFEYTEWTPGVYTGKGTYTDPQTQEKTEYATKSVNVRFAKDESMPHGFCLITVFPQIDEQAVLIEKTAAETEAHTPTEEEIEAKAEELRERLEDPDVIRGLLKNAYVPVGLSTAELLDNLLQDTDVGDVQDEP